MPFRLPANQLSSCSLHAQVHTADVVQADLLSPLTARLQSSVDILVSIHADRKWQQCFTSHNTYKTSKHQTVIVDQSGLLVHIAVLFRKLAHELDTTASYPHDASTARE